MGMALKVSKKINRASPRFFSKAALVVTILPLWALWVYAYATFETLQSEVEALPRFYGMYLYKEHVRSRLEGVARMMTLFEVRRGRGNRRGPVRRTHGGGMGALRPLLRVGGGADRGGEGRVAHPVSVRTALSGRLCSWVSRRAGRPFLAP